MIRLLIEYGMEHIQLNPVTVECYEIEFDGAQIPPPQIKPKPMQIDERTFEDLRQEARRINMERGWKY